MTPAELKRAAVDAMRRSAAYSSFWSDDDMEVLARATLAVALEAVESAIEREARRLGPAFFPDDAVSVVRSLLPPRSEERT